MESDEDNSTPSADNKPWVAKPEQIAFRRSREANARKQRVLELVQAGTPVKEAVAQVGVKWETYRMWRQRDPRFGATITETRRVIADERKGISPDDISHAGFAARYFNMNYAQFHLDFLDELRTTPPGNILMVLFPPEHGKTTMFENYANETLAKDADHRFIVVSENRDIARKIIGRVQRRMETLGPAAAYVARWGPFVPQTGEGRKPAQPWSADYFSVYKKSNHDERDYSMNALGAGSSIVSARCDHLHIDDLQSLKTLGRTEQFIDWFRQDALTRPGEHGITTIAGTRVGIGDFYETLMNDDSFDGILRVVKFPAIINDPITGEARPLWPERYTLEQLDRMRRKVGEAAWSRNYLQNPELPSHMRTFTDDIIDRAKDSALSIDHSPEEGAPLYLTVDPALGGRSCVMALEPSANGKLIVRGVWERAGLRTNEQIMDQIREAIVAVRPGVVTDVIIEAMNFQRGLARDERLLDMRAQYGFAVREHMTGVNKYDPNIGVPSMVTSFMKQELVIPWAADDPTRQLMGELINQLKAWQPLARGNKLRQDQVMTLWFGWILWRQRWKQPTLGGATGWKIRGVPWKPTKTSLILPAGVRV